MDLTQTRKRTRSTSNGDTQEAPPTKIPKVTPQERVKLEPNDEMEILIPIFVKLPTGKTLQIEADQTKTCLNLKKQISEACNGKGYSPAQQILSFAKTILDDSNKLSDYNIQQDSTIFVTAKLPPQDILGFDRCAACYCQAIEPCALPCGHSCCKTCVPLTALFCPVTGCKLPLVEDTTLQPNWLATHFFDATPTKPKQKCQCCAEDGVQQDATHWCESCSKAGTMEYYCHECVASEHSSKANKVHIRVPIEKMSSRILDCPEHKMPQDLLCLDDHVAICYRCTIENHKDHKTELVIEHEKKIKERLKSFLSVLTHGIGTEVADLKQSKQGKRAEIDRLEQEIVALETRIQQAEETTLKCQSASAVLMTSIQECPIQDLLDPKKLQILQTRVDQTLLLVKPLRPRPSPPVLKQRYSFKSKLLGPDSGFSRPDGVTIEPPTGNIFISDTENHKIQVFSADGAFIRSLVADFRYPCGLVFDVNGDLVVCDFGNNRAQVVDPLTAQLKLEFGSPNSPLQERLDDPYAVATDPKWNLVISGTTACRIQVFNPQGIWLRTIGFGQLNVPCGLAIDNQGTLFVCDSGNKLIRVYNAEGEFVKVIGKDLQNPYGVVVDAKGQLLVSLSHRVHLYSPGGLLLMAWGSKGSGDGKMNGPTALALDKEGNVILVDSNNNRVQIFG